MTDDPNIGVSLLPVTRTPDRAAIVAETEAAIVKWIRDGKGPYVEGYGAEIATAIERGEYKEPRT